MTEVVGVFSIGSDGADTTAIFVGYRILDSYHMSWPFYSFLQLDRANETLSPYYQVRGYSRRSRLYITHSQTPHDPS